MISMIFLGPKQVLIKNLLLNLITELNCFIGVLALLVVLMKFMFSPSVELIVENSEFKLNMWNK